MGHMTKYDVIVIGAGHNGLIAATILALHGLKILVVDKNARPGGLSSGWPGGSMFAYAVGLIPRELDAWLGLTDGLLHNPDPSWVELDETQKPVLRWWRDSHLLDVELKENGLDGISGFYALIEQFWRCTKRLGLYYTGSPPSRDEMQVLLDKCGGSEVVEKDSWRLIREYIGGREDLFLYPSMLSSNGFALAYYHQNKNYWGLPIGGMGAFSWKLYGIARKAGAEMMLGTRVTSIIVDKGKATGVRLGDDTEIAARAILYSASVPLLTRLVELPEGEHKTLEKLARLRYPVYRTDIILSKRPDPPREDSWRGYPILVYWTKDGGGEYSYPTLYSGAIGGLHVVQVGGSKVSPTSPAAPGVDEEVVIGYESRDPDSQMECCLNPTGHPDHIPMKDPYLFDERPMPGWGSYRTSIPCLYHGSASSYPGGEINGVAGLNAAIRILTDFGVRPSIPFLAKEGYKRTLRDTSWQGLSC